MTREEARQLGIAAAEAWSEDRLKGLFVAFPSVELLGPILSAIVADEVRRQDWEFGVAHAYGVAFIDRMAQRIGHAVKGHSTPKIQH